MIALGKGLDQMSGDKASITSSAVHLPDLTHTSLVQGFLLCVCAILSITGLPYHLAIP